MSGSSSHLPFYSNQRGSSPSGPGRRLLGPGSPFRIREKYVVFVGMVFIMIVCYSGFLLLPEDAGLDPNLESSHKQIHRAANIRDALKHPQRLVIPPPRIVDTNNSFMVPRHKQDLAQLQRQIDSAQIPKPAFADSPGLGSNVVLNARPDNNDRIKGLPSSPKMSEQSHPSRFEDPENVKRRTKVREMMKFAWDGYKKYAWGSNELRPSTKTGHSASIFGQGAGGATIVDAMDTLWLMGLKDEFNEGRKWIEMSYNLANSRGDLSVFETNIRFLGGLLSCYALTKDDLFKRKAVETADLLLPAFKTPTGIPLALVNLQIKSAKNWGWANGGGSILSEFGSLHVEFHYLSDITGNPIYFQKVQRIREVLKSLDKPNHLFPNYLNPRTGKWGARHVSVGALGDSFYEYLIKNWIATKKQDTVAKELYDEVLIGFETNLLQTSKNGLRYFAEMRGSRVDHKMDHLACFVGGMYGLTSVNEDDADKRTKYMNIAEDIAHTCHESYIRTGTGIGPESFRFTNEFEAKTVNERDKYYILRPEVIETWFYMWRLTRKPKYRQWCWDAVQAIEKYCKADVGYAGLRNVYDTRSNQDDVQQSFFLAETLKYLYLVFADDVLPLDQWILNTEAHPIPIRTSPMLNSVDPQQGQA